MFQIQATPGQSLVTWLWGQTHSSTHTMAGFVLRCTPRLPCDTHCVTQKERVECLIWSHPTPRHTALSVWTYSWCNSVQMAHLHYSWIVNVGLSPWLNLFSLWFVKSVILGREKKVQLDNKIPSWTEILLPYVICPCQSNLSSTLWVSEEAWDMFYFFM